MKDAKKADATDPEMAAMIAVHASLKDLNAEAQQRVLKYVSERLGLKALLTEDLAPRSYEAPRHSAPEPPAPVAERKQPDEPAQEGGFTEGISPLGLKWMQRNGLSGEKLSSLFNLGLDEIDLVARKVPGTSKAQRFRSVLLLKGVASYLGTGNAKVDSAAVKQAASHYNADLGNNVTSFIKSIGAEVTGSAATGYTLSARGLAAAKDLIDGMTDDPKK
jgi:hypothetical protein